MVESAVALAVAALLLIFLSRLFRYCSRISAALRSTEQAVEYLSKQQELLMKDAHGPLISGNVFPSFSDLERALTEDLEQRLPVSLPLGLGRDGLIALLNRFSSQNSVGMDELSTVLLLPPRGHRESLEDYAKRCVLIKNVASKE